MNKQSSGVRFESREIAVILSLFIMVSLLMFTVGIVVGKGLAQAKFEGNVQVSNANSPPETPHQHALGTSVSANPPIVHVPERTVAEASPQSENEEKEVTLKAEEFKPSEPLELKPKKSASLSIHDEIRADLQSPEAIKLLKNPKLKELFEAEKDTAPKKVVAQQKTKGSKDFVEGDFTQDSRAVASVKERIPPSYASGPYSVQVASYSEETQAKERVQTLKTLGFPHAYFSAINLGENKETWFRVWLGYYPSFESAKLGGEALQARGEVKNFLVRKSESSRP